MRRLRLGLANIVADGFSMAASNYLGTKTEKEEYAQIQEFERRQIQADPTGGTAEIREILRAKGFSGEALELAVRMFVSDREQWVRLMLTEEYGLPPVLRSQWKAAAATFVAFVVCGSIPLLPYFFAADPSLAVTAVHTLAAFFAVGALKSR
jgi:VIT1/CCC1 family predicted Fe2+/Mn2+ transporter